jgi:hypothetical protein
MRYKDYSVAYYNSTPNRTVGGGTTAAVTHLGLKGPSVSKIDLRCVANAKSASGSSCSAQARSYINKEGSGTRQDGPPAEQPQRNCPTRCA